MLTLSSQDKRWLQNHPLLSSLSQEEFKAIIPYIKNIHIPANSLIINMHQSTFDLYIIRKGLAKTYDRVNDHPKLSIAQFNKGDIIGEAGFLTHAKRLCDVIAKNNCDLFLISEHLKKKKLSIYNKLKESLQVLMIDRLRQSNKETLHLQKQQIMLLEEKLHFSRFFIGTILIFSVVIIINFALGHFLKNMNVYSPFFARVYLLLIAIPIILIAKVNHQPLSMFGLTTHHWKSTCIRGIIIAFFMVLLISTIKVIINWHHHLPLFYSVLYSFKRIPPLTYFFSVIVQQAIRAFWQNSLNKIFIGQSAYAIFFSSFIFGLFHIHIGLIASLFTFLIGIVFALIYQKDGNIIGLTIAHTLTGWMAYATGLI